MQTGISIYPGLDNTPKENLQLIESAAKLGITRIFTSLHILETDHSALKEEFSAIVQAARSHDMEIISDISPETLELLGMRHFSLSAFQFMGIHTLRIDYGYGAARVAELSRNTQNMRIQLNASTITGKFLTDLLQENANFDNIDALHNFYPREGTGLAEATLVRKTAMLHKAGISVGAFVPCHFRRRSPLRCGLPTLEMHRDFPLSLAARHLAAIGMDSIFIGDSLPSQGELETLAVIKENCVTMRAELSLREPVQEDLLAHVFTARLDEARDAVRAQESRALLKEMGKDILPQNQKMRPYGAITLDNKDYGRYMGELQIIKHPQPADARVNVAALIPEEEQFLINYIIPGNKFSFHLDDE